MTTMTTTTTAFDTMTLETLETMARHYSDERNALRKEALLSQEGTKSRADRLARCDVITRKLGKLYARMDALTGE